MRRDSLDTGSLASLYRPSSPRMGTSVSPHVWKEIRYGFSRYRQSQRMHVGTDGLRRSAHMRLHRLLRDHEGAQRRHRALDRAGLPRSGEAHRALYRHLHRFRHGSDGRQRLDGVDGQRSLRPRAIPEAVRAPMPSRRLRLKILPSRRNPRISPTPPLPKNLETNRRIRTGPAGARSGAKRSMASTKVRACPRHGISIMPFRHGRRRETSTCGAAFRPLGRCGCLK